MTGRHPMLAETLDASVIFHGCGRHNHDPTAASACGDGLKIVWTSEVASTGEYFDRVQRDHLWCGITNDGLTNSV